jgi:hypothetical protein
MIEVFRSLVELGSKSSRGWTHHGEEEATLLKLKRVYTRRNGMSKFFLAKINSSQNKLTIKAKISTLKLN